MKLIERDRGIEEAVERLKVVLGDTDKGMLVPWDTIEQTMGRSRNDRGGWHIVRKFREWVRAKRHIVTFPQTNDGLRFLTDKEAATESPMLRQRRARKQLWRCAREIGVIDRAKLTDWERRVLVYQERNILDERKNLGRSVRTMSALMRARELNPRALPEIPPQVSAPKARKSETNPPRFTKTRP